MDANLFVQDSRSDRGVKRCSAVLVCDTSGKVLASNEDAPDLFGYSLAELSTKTLHELIAPGSGEDDWGLALQQASATESNSTPRRLVMAAGMRGNGSEFEAELEILGRNEGWPDACVVIVRQSDGVADMIEDRIAERTRELQRRQQAAEGLRYILGILNSNKPLRVVLDYILAQACWLLDTTAGAVYWLEEWSKPLTIQAARGLTSEFVAAMRIPLGCDAVGRAVAFRKSIGIPDLLDLADDESFPEESALRARQLEYHRAVLAVPFVIAGEVRGCIALYFPDPKQFTSEDFELGVSFGDQAALAIENARLRAEAEQAAIAAERNRLARDLHDAVTQSLFSASLLADVLPQLWERNPDEARKRLQELRQLSRGALAEMRTLLLELRPSALTEVSLGVLLQHLTDATMGRAQIPIELTVENERPLPPDVQIGLFRLAQEALNNVAKHAEARHAQVRLIYRHEPQGTHVELRICDDGLGFDSNRMTPGHHGITIMRERAAAIGAALWLESQPGRGTEVRVRWPASAED